MEARFLLDNLEAVADYRGVPRVREMILSMAIKGALTNPDPADEPASLLLKRIETDLADFPKPSRVKREDPSQPDRDDALPSGWIWTTAEKLGQVNPRNQADDSESVGFVPMALIPTDIRQQAGYERRPWKTVRSGFTHVADNDIAIAKITPCFQNRKSVVFSGLPAGIGAATTEVFVLRPTPEGLDPRYALLVFKSPEFINAGVEKMTGTAGQQRVPRNYVFGTPFPLPPRAEQGRIVSVVDKLMSQCDELETRQRDRDRIADKIRLASLGSLANAKDGQALRAAWGLLSANFEHLWTEATSIDALRQTILQLAVQGKLTRQEQTDEPAEDLLQRLRSERSTRFRSSTDAEELRALKKLQKLEPARPPYPLPPGWTVARLSDAALLVVDCHNKTAPYSEDGIPIVRTSNLRNGQFIWTGMKYVSEETYERWSRRCPPSPGDIIFTREAPMGEAAIIPEGATFCLGQRTMLVRPAPDFVSAEYLLIALMEPGLLRRASADAVGSTVKHLRVGQVEGLPIMIPPRKEQDRVVIVVGKLMALCDRLEERLRDLSTHRAALQRRIASSAIR